MASLNEQKPDSSPSTLNGAEESHDLEKQPSQTAATDLARTLTQTMVPDLEQNVSRTTAPEIQGPKFPETDLDRGLVGWDGQDDPENPQNFASSKKWALLALISAFTFLSPLASSMFSPAVVFMAKEFHQTNETILAFTVSIYLVGYVVSDKLEIIGSQTSSTSTVVLTVRNLIYSSVLWYLPPLARFTVDEWFSAAPTGSSLSGKSDALSPKTLKRSSCVDYLPVLVDLLVLHLELVLLQTSSQ